MRFSERTKSRRRTQTTRTSALPYSSSRAHASQQPDTALPGSSPGGIRPRTAPSALLPLAGKPIIDNPGRRESPRSRSNSIHKGNDNPMGGTDVAPDVGDPSAPRASKPTFRTTVLPVRSFWRESAGRAAGSKNPGGAYAPPLFGGMYAPSRKGRRHAKLRHVCATPAFHQVPRDEGPKGQT
jgi:hypothetical protein